MDHKGAQYTDRPVETARRTADANNDVHQHVQPTPDLTAHIGGGAVDTFLPVPVALDHVGKELLANVFQTNYQRPHRDDWFTVGLHDQSTSLQVLANSVMHFQGFRDVDGIPQQSKLATIYYQLAVKSMRKRLAKLQDNGVLVQHSRRPITKQDPRTSKEIDALIGTAAAFICYTDIASLKEEWILHLTGLLHLVKLREGGLERLGPHLRSTISWVELRGAFVYDVPPRLPLPTAWMERYRSNRTRSLLYHLVVSTAIADIRRGWTTRFPDEGSKLWLSIFEDLARFSWLAEEDFTIAVVGEPGRILPEWTEVLLHRLLRIPQQFSLMETVIGGAHRSTLETDILAEACRLGCLLFLAPLWRKYEVTPVPTVVLLRKQSGLLKLLSLDGGQPLEPWLLNLLFWVLCISALETVTYAASSNTPAGSAEAEALTRRLISALASVAACMGIPLGQRQRVEAAMKRILWVDNVFDSSLERLTQYAQIRLTSQSG
ncbi:hypothetical protein LTR17_016187 [Elasticomyces elasticus]|nr:hypothetical protein LTR17_016187 [Elasticomyces elasticus]